MNGANHPMNGISAFPFGIFIENKPTIPNDIVPHKGDTVIGNDVWIGQNVTIMPGVKVGDGCIIGANAVVVIMFFCTIFNFFENHFVSQILSALILFVLIFLSIVHFLGFVEYGDSV